MRRSRPRVRCLSQACAGHALLRPSGRRRLARSRDITLRPDRCGPGRGRQLACVLPAPRTRARPPRRGKRRPPATRAFGNPAEKLETCAPRLLAGTPRNTRASIGAKSIGKRNLHTKSLFVNQLSVLGRVTGPESGAENAGPGPCSGGEEQDGRRSADRLVPCAPYRARRPMPSGSPHEIPGDDGCTVCPVAGRVPS